MLLLWSRVVDTTVDDKETDPPLKGDGDDENECLVDGVRAQGDDDDILFNSL